MLFYMMPEMMRSTKRLFATAADLKSQEGFCARPTAVTVRRFFLSADGKLLHYTHDFEFLAEHHTIYIHIHSISCTDRRVTMGYTSIVTAEQLTSDEKLIAGVSLSLDSIWDVAEIRIPGSAIFLGNTMVFRNNPIVFVRYFVASLKPDEYLIAIKGSPVFYVLSDELQQYTYKHPKLSDAGHIATRRDGYPGQRNGPVNLNWEVVKGDESTSYRFSFGSYGDYREESEHIPYGYIHVSVNNGIQVDYRFYEAAMQNELTGLNHTYALIRGVETSLLHRSFDLHANYLMVSGIAQSKSK